MTPFALHKFVEVVLCTPFQICWMYSEATLRAWFKCWQDSFCGIPLAYRSCWTLGVNSSIFTHYNYNYNVSECSKQIKQKVAQSKRIRYILASRISITLAPRYHSSSKPKYARSRACFSPFGGSMVILIPEFDSFWLACSNFVPLPLNLNPLKICSLHNCNKLLSPWCSI